jgi:hypothetical protein
MTVGSALVPPAATAGLPPELVEGPLGFCPLVGIIEVLLPFVVFEPGIMLGDPVCMLVSLLPPHATSCTAAAIATAIVGVLVSGFMGLPQGPAGGKTGRRAWRISAQPGGRLDAVRLEHLRVVQ